MEGKVEMNTNDAFNAMVAELDIRDLTDELLELREACGTIVSELTDLKVITDTLGIPEIGHNLLNKVRSAAYARKLISDILDGSVKLNELERMGEWAGWEQEDMAEKLVMSEIVEVRENSDIRYILDFLDNLYKAVQLDVTVILGN